MTAKTFRWIRCVFWVVTVTGCLAFWWWIIGELLK